MIITSKATCRVVKAPEDRKGEMVAVCGGFGVQ